MFPVFSLVWESLIYPSFLIVKELNLASRSIVICHSRGSGRGGADTGSVLWFRFSCFSVILGLVLQSGSRSGSRGGDEFFQRESSFSCLFTQTCCFSVAGFTGKGTEKAMKKEAVWV